MGFTLKIMLKLFDDNRKVANLQTIIFVGANCVRNIHIVMIQPLSIRNILFM